MTPPPSRPAGAGCLQRLESLRTTQRVIGVMRRHGATTRLAGDTGHLSRMPTWDPARRAEDERTLAECLAVLARDFGDDGGPSGLRRRLALIGELCAWDGSASSPGDAFYADVIAVSSRGKSPQIAAVMGEAQLAGEHPTMTTTTGSSPEEPAASLVPSECTRVNRPSMGRPSPSLAVTLRGLSRARSTLEDFVSSYFMFHGLDPRDPTHVFAHLPVLAFTEAIIYQLDDANEEPARGGVPPRADDQTTSTDSLARTHVQTHIPPSTPSVSRHSTEESDLAVTRLMSTLEAHLGAAAMRPVAARLRRELADGVRYWALERKLCAALQSRQRCCQAPVEGREAGGPDVNVEEAKMALRLKSFDYRVLNLVLHASLCRVRLERRRAEQRRRQERGSRGDDPALGRGAKEENSHDDVEVNETHAAFLATSELLVELADDLYDYEEDVASGAFNIFRCLVAAHGPVEAQNEMVCMIRAAEAEYQRAMATLEPALAARYRERCREATKAGAVCGDLGGGEDAPDGRWLVPPPIVDEEAFRRRAYGNEEDVGIDAHMMTS